jgi:hypothetical protein
MARTEAFQYYPGDKQSLVCQRANPNAVQEATLHHIASEAALLRLSSTSQPQAVQSQLRIASENFASGTPAPARYTNPAGVNIVQNLFGGGAAGRASAAGTPSMKSHADPARVVYVTSRICDKIYVYNYNSTYYKHASYPLRGWVPGTGAGGGGGGGGGGAFHKPHCQPQSVFGRMFGDVCAVITAQRKWFEVRLRANKAVARGGRSNRGQTHGAPARVVNLLSRADHTHASACNPGWGAAR